MCDHHGEYEEQEEAVVGPANAAVEEEAVVVVVLDAHVTQLAVFGKVWEKELADSREGENLEMESLKINVHILTLVFPWSTFPKENIGACSLKNKQKKLPALCDITDSCDVTSICEKISLCLAKLLTHGRRYIGTTRGL